MKQVSDVGVRFLANACPNLECVNGELPTHGSLCFALSRVVRIHILPIFVSLASGMCLLTDGVQRDFGHEGLQSLAKAECTKHIKRLNLHGCFRVSNISLKALSSMENLDCLVLSGCKSLSLEGMSHVFKTCTKLSLVSLASCGDCVTDAMLDVMGANLCRLKTLDLSEGIKVGRKGLRSLSQCSTLFSLNLSGCKKISNEAVLALGDGHYHPGIRELYLNRCTKLDDIVMTFIGDSFKDMSSSSGIVTLVTLALKGTK